MYKYEITIDQTWSETVKVSAKSEKEAKKKAFEKWKPKKGNYKIFVDKQND